MNAMLPAALVVGLFATCSAHAQVAVDNATQGNRTVVDQAPFDARLGDVAMRSVSGWQSAFGRYADSGTRVPSQISGSGRRRSAGVQAYGFLLGGDYRVLSDIELRAYWLDSIRTGRPAFTIGYAWRDVRVERTTLSVLPFEESESARNMRLRFDSSANRLSFSPSTHWTLRISHGTLGDLDQFQPNEHIRRSAISATYSYVLKEGIWQTTLAWGRSSRSSNEPVKGYLLESNFRFHRAHAIFGRVEQVGSDDLARENAAPQQQFKMNKLTVGYFHHIDTQALIGIDIGGFVSRRLVPSVMAPSYGSNPTSYMLFVRLTPH